MKHLNQDAAVKIVWAGNTKPQLIGKDEFPTMDRLLDSWDPFVGTCPNFAAVDVQETLLKWESRLGLGFHPDTDGADYVDHSGKRSLNKAEAAEYDADIQRCFDIAGDMVYDLALAIMQALEVSGNA